MKTKCRDPAQLSGLSQGKREKGRWHLGGSTWELGTLRCYCTLQAGKNLLLCISERKVTSNAWRPCKRQWNSLLKIPCSPSLPSDQWLEVRPVTKSFNCKMHSLLWEEIPYAPPPQKNTFYPAFWDLELRAYVCRHVLRMLAWGIRNECYIEENSVCQNSVSNKDIFSRS